MLLLLAFWLLCAAALLGGGLLVLYLRGPAAPPPPAVWRARTVHAAVGVASLTALLLALRRGLPRVANMGTGGFGMTAAALLVLALGCGLLIARAGWRGRRPVELLVGVHAGLAIAGFALLLTLVALG